MLIDDLESDGKLKVAVLRAFYEEWVLEEGFTSVVAEAVASGVETLEYNGGSLLLHHLNMGGRLGLVEWELIVDALSLRMHWTCRLSICRGFTIAPNALEVDSVSIASFLNECVLSDNSFVRAWAISAFWELGKQYPDYKDEAEDYRERGEKDDAKCVQSRMRQLNG